MPKSSMLFSDELELYEFNKGNIKSKVIKNFLIFNITGKNDSLGLKFNNKFFIHKFQNNINKKEYLVDNIMNFLKKNHIIVDNQFSIIVNQGPGSFSAIRTSLAIAKGIQITKKIKLYGFVSAQLPDFTIENIEILIKNNKLENKLIKPLYIS